MPSKITLFTLIIFFASLQVSVCQDFANAVLIKTITPSNKYQDSLYQKTKTILQKSSGSDILLYDWDAKAHTVNFKKDNKSTEVPSKNIVFIDPIYAFSENPEIKLTVDTTGKTTGAYFEISGNALINFKALETGTSKVVKIKTIEVIKAFSERINIPDFAKEFGGDPNAIRKSNSNNYNALCKKILAKFWPQAEKKYLNAIHDANYPLSSLKKRSFSLATCILSSRSHYYC